VFCDVLEQFKQIMDVSYECPSTIYLGKENVEEVLKTVDCSLPEARWDFKIQVSIEITN
jgi:hypothetical protein